MRPKSPKNILIPLAGILAVIAGMIPFFVLRGKCSVMVRDELDGEIVGYILGARYLFSGIDYYPEFLGGVFKQALTPPSFLTLLLFHFFSPLNAYIINRFFVMLVAFAGMYLWLDLITKDKIISLFVSVAFAFLPFFTVYGISVAGMPLVFWAFACLYLSPDIKKLIISYICIAFYGLGSSFVLCGYAVLAILGLVFFCALTFGHKKGLSKKTGLRALFGILILFIVYMVSNFGLVMQVLGNGSSYISHKEESLVNEASFFAYMRELFAYGSSAVPSVHTNILYVSVIFAVLIPALILVKKKPGPVVKKYYKLLLGLIFSALAIAVFSALFHLAPVAGYLNSKGGVLKSFQADRFYWLYPFIWYSALAVSGVLSVKAFSRYHAGVIVFAFLYLFCAFPVLKESAFKENAMEFFRDNSTALTWDAFFCRDEFEEIADYIEGETGMTRDMYRVGSLGIEPSVAFYSGFYTIDGYSNNYDIEYKHRFRKAIAAELEKNPYNMDYFDNWGNRCYLFSSEYYGHPLLSKYEHPYFADLEFDTESLKELDCKYILSAGMIEGAEDKGYRLCRVFDKPEYTYVIYLYEIV